MKLIRFATNALSTKKWGSNTPISPASLPSRAGALFSCRLSSFWQSAGLQNHRPLVRIHPHENPNFLQTENRQRISTLAVFLWARVDYASRAAKNSPLGCFCPFFCDGAAAVRIHPPSLWEGYYKTETPVPGSDTGVLGGRGWIRTTEAEKQQIYSLSPLATREHAHILFAVIADCLYILSSEVAFVNYFFHGFSLFLSFSIFLRFTAIKALPITAKDPKTFSVLRSFWS